MRQSVLSRLLGIYQLFIGIGAIFGGLGLILNPDGGALGMSLDLLEGSLFRNYLIPGIFLFSVNGLGSIAGGIITLRRQIIAGELAMGLGIILVLWILIQGSIIGFTSFLQLLYGGIGVGEFFMGWNYRTIVRREQDIS